MMLIVAVSAAPMVSPALGLVSTAWKLSCGSEIWSPKVSTGIEASILPTGNVIVLEGIAV